MSEIIALIIKLAFPVCGLLVSYYLVLKFFGKYKETTSVITAWSSFIVVVLAFWGATDHFEFMRFENFKHFNEVYDEWYSDMPKDIKKNAKENFKELDEEGKAWVRRYFNLYVQEYYFYKNKMITKDMWIKFVHGCDKEKKNNAAFRNLKEYPALLQGYFYWKEKGSFNFPKEFRKILEDDLERCGFILNNMND